MRRRQMRLTENMNVRVAENGSKRAMENYSFTANSYTLKNSGNLLTLESTGQTLLENGISLALEI